MCMPQVKPDIETFAKIKVVGVGGSGGSAVNRMVESNIRGVEFLAFNTDVQALHHNTAPRKIHIGRTVTRGLGAGMNPDLGKRSAEESQNEIREALKDTDMIFITCGLGGGTGSGAAPIVASIAQDMGILTVAVVTKPFSFEGPQRKMIAEEAYAQLVHHVDTIITIPNDRILQIIDKKTSLLDAFKIVDDVLRQGVQGISELVTVPGLINVDFADVKTIMSNTGSALMGIGIGSGENRAIEAAKAAISSPLLEISIDGARGILFTITGGSNLGMQEVAEAAKIITSSADENVKVIFGAVVDERMGEDVRVTVVATGFDQRDFAAREREGAKVALESSTDPGLDVFTARPFGIKSGLFTKQTSEPVPEEVDTRNVPQPEPRRPFVKKNVSSDMDIPTRTPSPQSSPTTKQVDGEDEDLEIPTFLRKKMGM